MNNYVYERNTEIYETRRKRIQRKKVREKDRAFNVNHHVTLMKQRK